MPAKMVFSEPGVSRLPVAVRSGLSSVPAGLISGEHGTSVPAALLLVSDPAEQSKAVCISLSDVWSRVTNMLLSETAERSE